MNYNPANWYWIIDGDETKIWSSANACVVLPSDETYAEWVAAGGEATRIASTVELQQVMATVFPAGTLESYTAAKRFALETGGFAYDGHPVATDRDSQGKIGNGALAATITGDTFTTQWKGADGVFFSLDHAGMIAMATSVMSFINACFGAEAEILTEIAAGTIKTTAEIDAFAWPSN